MLSKRQQKVLKAIVDRGDGKKCERWRLRAQDNQMQVTFISGLWDTGIEGGSVTFSAATLYALAHHGLVAFVDATTVSPTPKGEALAALLDETTMVTRRGNGVVIS